MKEPSGIVAVLVQASFYSGLVGLSGSRALNPKPLNPNRTSRLRVCLGVPLNLQTAQPRLWGAVCNVP